MRDPSRNSAEYHRFRPDSGCVLYFELRMAATAISNSRDPKTARPLLIISTCQRTYDQCADREALS